jgi:D-methionine transport system substrate-binding protein
MKYKVIFTLAASAALAGALALSGCSSSSQESSSSGADANSKESTTITIAATATPHAEILNDVVAPLLAEQGITLEVREFSDYVQPNTTVEQGEIDANYFQHINYLDSFNEENGTHLVSVGYVHYEPFGLYAGKSNDIENIADGAKIAVSNDTTNEARALLLLEQEGIIKLKDGAGVTATPNDIVENPHNVEIVELEAAQVARSLQDVDFAIVNGNYALQAGLNVNDALATESSEGEAAKQYGNVLVVKEGNENTEAIQALYAALTSDDVKEYIEKTYNGAVVALF